MLASFPRSGGVRHRSRYYIDTSVNSVNFRLGYQAIDIRTPREAILDEHQDI